MPYGAHETMEVHECLMEKINMITHFNLYMKEAKNPNLRDMIARHRQEEILSYNEIVSYTHDQTGFRPIPPNTDIRGVNPQQIQYGLRNPPSMGPQSDTAMSDGEVATAMLLCHKNAARNGTWATLECADPNLRRMLLNSTATCINQAYEVFLFMNEQGMYQVPTLNDHTAKTFLHRYQPAEQALQQQYGMQQGQGMQQEQGMQQYGMQQGQGMQGQGMYAGGQAGYGTQGAGNQNYGGSQSYGSPSYAASGMTSSTGSSSDSTGSMPQ